MAVTVYSSTDTGPGTPVLTGQVSSLLTLLDACLVNGYTGKPAAGWSKPFANAGNKGCYKGGSGNQLFLAVDDAGTNATSGAREAQAHGFETLSSVSAGTNAFPTTTQIAVNGLVIRKSQTADATAQPWILIADDRTFYLHINTLDFPGYSTFMFGEFASDKTADGFRTIIIGKPTQGAIIPLASDDALQNMSWQAISPANLSGHYCARGPKGDIAGAAPVGKHVNAVPGTSAAVTAPRIGDGMVTYPNITSGGLLHSVVSIQDNLGNLLNIRGRMRGLRGWLHPSSSPVQDGSTYAGSGVDAGHTFLIVKPSAIGDGLYVYDITGPWETTN